MLLVVVMPMNHQKRTQTMLNNLPKKVIEHPNPSKSINRQKPEQASMIKYGGKKGNKQN